MIVGSAASGWLDIIKTKEAWRQIIKLFDKLFKASQKGSLELQMLETVRQLLVQNLIEARRLKRQ